jgi:iron complex outermembrane receptor protein
MKSWTGRLLPLAACLLLSAPARPAADLADLPLEHLLAIEVEGAARFMQPLSEAPAAVSVVTAEDIRRFGYRHVGEALQSLRGVYTTNERDYVYLGIRGFARPGDYNTRMLMMADGLRLNDPIYDTAPIGHEAPIEMEWIKRLEFVPGPGSALYGANAIFGVANAVLLTGGDLNGNRVSADIGSQGLARLGLLSGQREADGRDWIVGVSAYRRHGADLHFPEFEVPGASDGIARGLDAERYLKAFAKLGSGAWQVAAGLSSRRKDVPTAYYGTLFDTPGNFIQDDYGYASVGHSKTLANDWTQNLRLRAGAYRYQGEYVSAGLLSRDETAANWWGLDYLLTYTGLRDHKILIGSEMQRNQRLRQRYLDVDPPADYLDDRRAGNAVGLFVQDEWRIGQHWMTNIGLRVDRLAGFSAASPRAALIYHPVPAAALKLLHGRAFRPPNSYERFYSDGDASQKANPDLRPERIVTNELVAEYAFSPSLRVAGSYYRYRLRHLVEQTIDPADALAVFVNRAPIEAQGLEVEVESLFRNGLRVKGSLARQNVRQPFGDPVNSPRRMGKLQVDGPVFGSQWILGLGLRAMSRRHGFNGDVPGHVVGNLILTRKNTDRLGEWSLAVYNLSGHRYLDPTSATLTQTALAQDGREYRLGWKLGF